MTSKVTALFFFFVLAIGAIAQTVKPVDPYASFPKGTTYWTNERGSTIRIDNGGNGQISGKFTTAVGCGKGIARPLVGAYNGNSVGFVVQFGKDCPSTTSWNGTLSLGTPNRLKTLWFLTSGGMPAWNSTNAGHDLFTEIVPTAAPAELK
jgi:Avidin family